MSPETPGKRLLENAYELETASDNIAYYNEFAESYDQDFASELGYALPQSVAETFHALAGPAESLVVDIGCGTGLLGEALGECDLELDGLDISSAMLSRARQRKCYRELYEVDITTDISLFDQMYNAVLSSGTFTHGHLGPECFIKLLDIAQPKALFVIAINQAHYESMGFDRSVEQLDKQDAIYDFVSESVPIYKHSTHAHSDDKGLILSFRKS